MPRTIPGAREPNSSRSGGSGESTISGSARAAAAGLPGGCPPRRLRAHRVVRREQRGDDADEHGTDEVGMDQHLPAPPPVQQHPGERTDEAVGQQQDAEAGGRLCRGGGVLGVEEHGAGQAGLEDTVGAHGTQPSGEQPREARLAPHHAQGSGQRHSAALQDRRVKPGRPPTSISPRRDGRHRGAHRRHRGGEGRTTGSERRASAARAWSVRDMTHLRTNGAASISPRCGGSLGGPHRGYGRRGNASPSPHRRRAASPPVSRKTSPAAVRGRSPLQGKDSGNQPVTPAALPYRRVSSQTASPRSRGQERDPRAGTARHRPDGTSPGCGGVGFSVARRPA